MRSGYFDRSKLWMETVVTFKVKTTSKEDLMRIASLLSLALLASCVTKVPPHDEVKVPEPAARSLTLTGEDMIVLGDQGTGTDHQYKVAASIEKYCSTTSQCGFGIMVGDNFYPAGVESTKDSKWKSYLEKPYKNLGSLTFYPTLGNHDYLGNWKAQIAYRSTRWNMPYRYYKLKTPHADILCLDSEYMDKDQLAWAEKELKASKAAWQVVYLHRPIYSSGEHGDSSTLKKLLLPILELNGVDVVFSGHDHDLEIQQRAGMLHIVSGSGGKMRSLKTGPYTLFGKGVPGFVAVDFEPTSLLVKFIGEGGKILYTKMIGAQQLMEDQ